MGMQEFKIVPQGQVESIGEINCSEYQTVITAVKHYATCTGEAKAWDLAVRLDRMYTEYHEIWVPKETVTTEKCGLRKAIVVDGCKVAEYECDELKGHGAFCYDSKQRRGWETPPDALIN